MMKSFKFSYFWAHQSVIELTKMTKTTELGEVKSSSYETLWSCPTLWFYPTGSVT